MARTFFRAGQHIDARLIAHFHDTVLSAIRQLRLALGTGYIFYGFDLREEPESGMVRISPGVAFDGNGEAVALERPLAVPPPDEDGPFFLCLRHHLLVDEQDLAGRAVREEDSVEVIWQPEVPRDDSVIPLARLQRRAGSWLIDGSVARRAPSLAHRHSGATLPDRSDRLRFDGYPVRLTSPEIEEQRDTLYRLETAVAAEFSKVNTLLEELEGRQAGQAEKLEEVQVEMTRVAALADRLTEVEQAGDWQEAIAGLREEMSLTVGEEVREELDLLRSEVTALSQRPASISSDGGVFTPISALHGVGDGFAQKLRDAGIETVSDLLVAAANPAARERVEATGIAKTRLRRWSREADLLRLHGVGPNEVALLDSVGVSGTAALALEEPSVLYDRLRKTAQERCDLVPPAYAWVESWIEQAKHLPPVMEW